MLTLWRGAYPSREKEGVMRWGGRPALSPAADILKITTVKVSPSPAAIETLTALDAGHASSNWPPADFTNGRPQHIKKQILYFLRQDGGPFSAGTARMIRQSAP